MDLVPAFSTSSVALIHGTKLSFIMFLQILITFWRPDIVDKDNRVKIVPTQDILHSYDFIVIGGGTAGSVIASRLTENENWTVLLLEAGGDEAAISDVPILGPILQQSDMDWKYKAEPSSKYCLGLDNNQSRWPSGKTLGGSSATNFMVYVRGNSKDYDEWRDFGNPGWGYDDVLPYFKKSENISIPELQDSPYHGTGGYLTVEHPRQTSPLAKHMLNAGRDLGYDIVDANGASQTGFMPVQGTLKDGLRCSTAKAFLRPASKRKNLIVSTRSIVHKILVNEETKTAYGVKFEREDKEYIVHAKKEVILSAGAVRSPQVLMLSGIGPREHLEEVGVEVIHDSPGVGQNLQDHVAIGGIVQLFDPPVDDPTVNSDLLTVSKANELLMSKNGSLYGFLAGEVLGFVSTSYAPSDYPDVELIFFSVGDNMGDGHVVKKYFGLKDDLFENLYGNILNNNTYTMWPMLLRPKSRGYIKLRNTDPHHHPVIVPNYFDDPRDLDVLIEGVKIIFNLSRTPTLKTFNVRPNPNLIPECAHLVSSFDDYWRCHARHFTATIYHASSTCKMGPADDAMAVVDPRLRVYGVKGLRIADTSIMPNIVSGHTVAPAIMIGEKASDLIKEDILDSYFDTN